MIKRRKTRVIRVGGVKIGGRNPVIIQSMTKVKTSNVRGVQKQIKELEQVGCGLVRVAVKDFEDAGSIQEIKKKIKIPLIADIHFDYRLAIESIINGADKIRLNPGNISKPKELKEIIYTAKRHHIPIRIGLNSGSLPKHVRNRQHAIRNTIRFARGYINFFEKEGFYDIIISLKSSNVCETVYAYRKLACLCDYPFHLGVTAAGTYDTGIIKSSIGIGALLIDGIGDTIRVSLTGSPVQEVIAAERILQTSGAKNFGPDIISCPTCGRCQVDLIDIVKGLETKLCAKPYRRYAKRAFSIAVMGCEVNGPGEAREADIGIAFGKGSGVLFKKGKIVKKIKEKNAVKELLKLITYNK